MLRTKKRGRAQLEDDQDDGENSGDEPPSDGEIDASPHMVRPKPTLPNQRAPKRMKRVSPERW